MKMIYFLVQSKNHAQIDIFTGCQVYERTCQLHIIMVRKKMEFEGILLLARPNRQFSPENCLFLCYLYQIYPT